MESNKANLAIALSFVAILFVGVLYFLKEPTGLISPLSEELGLVVPAGSSLEMGTLRVVELYKGTTTSATSGPINISGAKKVTFEVVRAEHSSGNSEFFVYVSGRNADVKNDYRISPHVRHFANSGLGLEHGIATSTTLAANGTTTISMDLLYNTFSSAKCSVAETTDGQHSCSVWVER